MYATQNVHKATRRYRARGFAHAATTIYRILGDFRGTHNRGKRTAAESAVVQSALKRQTTRARTPRAARICIQRNDETVRTFSHSHSLFVSTTLSFTTSRLWRCTPKSWTPASENHANNSSVFHPTSHRNLIRTRGSPIIIGIV